VRRPDTNRSGGTEDRDVSKLGHCPSTHGLAIYPGSECGFDDRYRPARRVHLLCSDKQLERFSIGATDGPIGKVKDFHFDDEAWVIRYLVADTSKWLGGRDVLISPYALGRPDLAAETQPVTVSKGKVRNSPSADSHLPVSRQYETDHPAYYGFPYAWGGTGLSGQEFAPGTLAGAAASDPYDGYRGYLRAPTSRDGQSDPHLRSCDSVRAHHVVASDGEIGHG